MSADDDRRGWRKTYRGKGWRETYGGRGYAGEAGLWWMEPMIERGTGLGGWTVLYTVYRVFDPFYGREMFDRNPRPD